MTPRKADSETGLPAMHPGELLREDILPALGRPRVEIARLLVVQFKRMVPDNVSNRVAIERSGS